MDSPIAIGDTTTNSINHRLTNTHLSTNFVSVVNASIYSGEKCIQLNLKFPSSSSSDELKVLRRVQDSYVNVSQLFNVLVTLQLFKPEDTSKFIDHEIKSNPQYFNGDGYTPEFNDLSSHQNSHLRGVWIPFDKAVTLANKLDVYPLVKKLFLVDVHDFDELPKHIETEKDQQQDEQDETESKKRKLDEGDSDDDMKQDQFERNLTKKFKGLVQSNSNYPYPMATVSVKEKNHDVVHDIKQKFGDIFKRNETSDLSEQDIKTTFEKYLPNKEDIVDIPLDNEGKTALHYASTLASLNLVAGFINTGVTSPIRGTKTGENPLISCIKVTNSMEKGNFPEILKLLAPNVFLINHKNASFLHLLAGQAKKLDSCKYYVSKILDFVLATNTNQFYFKKLIDETLNLQDKEGNSALHLAIENENKWLIEILIELKADLTVVNKAGLKPVDFDIVKEILNCRKLGMKNEYFDEDDYFLVELIRTNFETLRERLEVNNDIIEDEDIITTKEEPTITENATATNKLFNSINELLKNTNKEYENLMNTKKSQINNLNKQLYETTLITANNKFLNRKIHEKLMYLDNLKLQMTNITEKLEMIKNEIPNDLDEKFDADQPFRIDTIHDALVKGGDVEELKNDDELINSLPDSLILKARINSYKQLNENIEGELKVLTNYSTLTSKFKKVVSFCTGVDINEVDELLDGLLEAVETQS